MQKSSFIKTLVIGNLANDFIINIAGKAFNHILGGSLPYAAAGAKLWGDEIGLISRIDNPFPVDLLKDIESRGFETRGITKSSQLFESRRFFAWTNPEKFDSENPVANYARYGLTFPHELLGYHQTDISADDLIWEKIFSSLRKELPREFLDVAAAHLCPLDFSSQVKLLNLLETGSFSNLTISPSNQYMTPAYLEKLPILLKDATAFLPTESQITKLCLSRTKDMWEMAEIVANMGCLFVVILRKERGVWMYEAASRKRYSLPAYPTRWLDPTGNEDVFSGAFLSEYKNSYDPEHALICASVALSLAVEGTGPFYCLDALTGLSAARINMMKSFVRVN